MAAHHNSETVSVFGIYGATGARYLVVSKEYEESLEDDHEFWGNFNKVSPEEILGSIDISEEGIVTWSVVGPKYEDIDPYVRWILYPKTEPYPL